MGARPSRSTKEAQMLDVLLLFPLELDAAEVDELLAKRLIPQFTRATGLRSLRHSDGTVMSRGAPSPYSRVLEASFDTLADWMATVNALNSMGGSSADREAFQRLAPLVVFFEVAQPAPPLT
jgi:hypothetical protein